MGIACAGGSVVAARKRVNSMGRGAACRIDRKKNSVDRRSGTRMRWGSNPLELPRTAKNELHAFHVKTVHP